MSDVGRQRQQNEDSMFVDEELGLFVVCDGMGGHQSGEIAAGRAVDTVSAYLSTKKAEILEVAEGTRDPAELRDLVRQAVDRANAEVYALGTSVLEYHGMGCTLTLMLAAGESAVMAHVGDSRLYLLHRGGKARQISHDHTVTQELVALGVVAPEDAPDHAYAHLLSRSIGTKDRVEVEVVPIRLCPGDRFLICSDGLADYIPDTDWLAKRLSGADVEKVVEGLIDFANEEGGTDNITVVVGTIMGADDEPDLEGTSTSTSPGILQKIWRKAFRSVDSQREEE